MREGLFVSKVNPTIRFILIKDRTRLSNQPLREIPKRRSEWKSDINVLPQLGNNIRTSKGCRVLSLTFHKGWFFPNLLRADLKQQKCGFNFEVETLKYS